MPIELIRSIELVSQVMGKLKSYGTYYNASQRLKHHTCDKYAKIYNLKLVIMINQINPN